MAMTTCKECRSSVSTEAKTCPSCGAPVPKGWTVGKTIVLIIGAAFILNIASKSGAPEDPEAAGRKAAADRVDQERFNQVVAVGRAIKQTLREPDSVDWEAIFADERGNVVCVRYRARNGFGGYNREHLVRVGNEAHNTAVAWAAACNAATHDMLHAKYAL